MCHRYQWLSKSVAHDLFEKHNDVTDLVEADVLQMFPIDEPSSFATPVSFINHNYNKQLSSTKDSYKGAISKVIRD